MNQAEIADDVEDEPDEESSGSLVQKHLENESEHEEEVEALDDFE